MEGDKKVIPVVTRAGAAVWSTFTQEEKDVCVMSPTLHHRILIAFFFCRDTRRNHEE
jgi:hypothetical protein